jgi:hypothetical protein
MDPILLSDTSDEEDMPQQTKRRGIAKKRKVVDAPAKKKTRGSLHKNTIGLRCHTDDDESSSQDSNASDIEDESNNEDVEELVCWS